MPEQKPQVLVIDDDPIIRKLIVTVSRQAGYVTSEASNGAEALEMVEKGEFSLLILDLMLPSISGHDVLERLDPASGCSIIVVTASDDQALKQIDSRLVCDIVRKPFDIHRLEAAISAAFESRVPAEGRLSDGRLHLRAESGDDSSTNEVGSAGTQSADEPEVPESSLQDEDPIVE